jgi:hypothetical protein
MDPNEALEQLRQLSAQPSELLLDDGVSIRRLIELFDGLDVWLSSGGFLPAAWER